MATLGSMTIHLGIDTDAVVAGAKRAIAILGTVAASASKIGLALGAAIPAAAGLAAALAQMAPAAGLAATATLAAVSAAAALKIGMSGVKDAVAAAFDPSDPEAYAEALKKLSPNARSFVEQLRTMQPALKSLQLAVQDRLFAGMDTSLARTARETLPTLRRSLLQSAGAMNAMGRDVLDTAASLGKSGTLGVALDSANAGLKNFTRLPGVLLQGLVQVGAAAGPAFERLTAAGGGALDTLSAKMTTAFESGAMTRAIETAISLVGDLMDVLGNVGSIIGSVFSAADVSGAGFLNTLKTITGALAQAFNSPAVQAGLSALFETVAKLAETAGPLLVQALQIVGGVLAELGPPAQRLIEALGGALGPIIEALGPVLVTAAEAVGVLVDAVAPLLPVIGELVAALLPAITPLLDALMVVFEALAPVIGDVGRILADTLGPILAQLPALIGPLAAMLADNLVFYLQLFGELLVALAPSLVTLAETFAELMIAVGPLITVFADLTAGVMAGLMPLLLPLIQLVGQLASVLAGRLSQQITGVVIPAVQGLAMLLKGDFSGAWGKLKEAAGGAIRSVIQTATAFPSKVIGALAPLAGRLWNAAVNAGGRLVAGIRSKLTSAVDWVRGLPARAKSALGDLGSKLWNAGARLISGFIDGIKSKISGVKDTLSGLTSSLTSWKGPENVDKKLLTPAGQFLIEGFQRGIAAQVPALRSQLQGLTADLPGMTAAVSGVVTAGRMDPQETRVVFEVTGQDEGFRRLIREMVRLDGGGDVQTAFG